MPIINARRLKVFGVERIRALFGCTTNEATTMYAEAVSTCAVADARKAMATLNECAAALNVTTEQLLARIA